MLSFSSLDVKFEDSCVILHAISYFLFLINTVIYENPNLYDAHEPRQKEESIHFLGVK